MTEEVKFEILVPSQDSEVIHEIAKELKEGQENQWSVDIEVHRPMPFSNDSSVGTRSVEAFEVINVVLGVGNLALLSTQIGMAVNQVLKSQSVTTEVVVKRKMKGKKRVQHIILKVGDSIEDIKIKVKSLFE